MADTIKIPFSWRMLRPNNEQYRQNSIELEPISLVVNVEVPLNKENIDNFVEITQYQLNPNNSHEELPILTPIGMAFCLNALTDVLYVEEVKDKVKDDEDWDDEEKSSPKEFVEDKDQSPTQNESDWDEDNNKDNKEETFDDDWS